MVRRGPRRPLCRPSSPKHRPAAENNLSVRSAGLPAHAIGEGSVSIMNKLEHKDRLSVTGYKRAEVGAASGSGHGGLGQPPHRGLGPEPFPCVTSPPGNKAPRGPRHRKRCKQQQKTIGKVTKLEVKRSLFLSLEGARCVYAQKAGNCKNSRGGYSDVSQGF